VVEPAETMARVVEPVETMARVVEPVETTHSWSRQARSAVPEVERVEAKT